MNIYHISQSKVGGYDTFDSAVVIAKSAKAARHIHPQSAWGFKRDPWKEEYSLTWCKSPEDVSVGRIGTALKREKAGVICASFNAG